ncbi:MAG: DNA repair protein RecO [Gammaproteobacteria bacterium]
MRIPLQPAFILHHRSYRETSLLLDVFTEEYGRIGLVARGVRQSRSKWRGLLQPFVPLLVSFQGKTELMTLQNAEPQGIPIHLQNECLLSGFYLNELMVRLLQKHDPHPQLYTIYRHTLLELERAELQQKHLRLFEKNLLIEIGYGLQLQSTISDGKPLLADRFYRFYPESGFELANSSQNEPKNWIFSGKSLLALRAEQLDDPESLQDAKRLMRLALGVLLGSEPLHSRKLFTGVTVT